MKVVFAKEALVDLKSFKEYIAPRNPSAGKRMLQQVRASALSLADNPLKGKQGKIHGTRELVVPDTPLTMVYIADPELITVLFIPHHRQRWAD